MKITDNSLAGSANSQELASVKSPDSLFSKAGQGNGAKQFSTPARLKGVSIVGAQSQLKGLSLFWTSCFSIVIHVVAPVIISITLLLGALFLSWLFQFDLFKNWFVQKPPVTKTIEFMLVEDQKSAPPKVKKRNGSFNQLAGGENNKKRPVKASLNNSLKTSEKATQKRQKITLPTPQTQQSSPPLKPPSASKLPGLLQPKVATQPLYQDENSSDVRKIEALQRPSAGDDLRQTMEVSNPEKGAGKLPGVDVTQDNVMGPFMSELEQKIKKNWFPPRGTKNRRILVLFYIARDGTVLHTEIRESSGSEKADEAAILAVKAAEPFLNFPAQVNQDVLPVQFSFDYNVLNNRK